jgi:hypothetical protein
MYSCDHNLNFLGLVPQTEVQNVIISSVDFSDIGFVNFDSPSISIVVKTYVDRMVRCYILDKKLLKVQNSFLALLPSWLTVKSLTKHSNRHSKLSKLWPT